ncbi:MAG: AAA domain-containing protein [Catenulispora sp.]|nr:AAA domain-containing protein [Catenulispora sp.]
MTGAQWDGYYRGDGVRRAVDLPEAPPWRTFPRQPMSAVFQPPPGLREAVNAALWLRRPLLITGLPGSGKSTVIEQVSAELDFGPVLRWHVTSRSTLTDALYQYDALGRIHAQRLGAGDDGGGADDIAPFLQLGPLGTALLPSPRPRALLVDEIDKSDLDLPSDLLDVLESGEFEIPELVRYERDEVRVRLHQSRDTAAVVRGRIACTQFPFIVLTSNGEQIFPAPFLRRCVRFTMPRPSPEALRALVGAHLRMDVPEGGPVADIVRAFADRLEAGEALAIDQLLNAVFLLSREGAPQGVAREELAALLMQELSRA